MSQNRTQNRAARNGNRPNGKKRRAYDQNKDNMRRTPPQGTQNRRSANSNYGYQEAVEFPTRRQNNPGQRTSSRPRPAQNAGRSGNSIEFPTQTAHRPQNGQRSNRTNAGQNRHRNNTAQYPGTPSGKRPQNRTAQQRRQPPNGRDRKSTRLNSSHLKLSRMPSSA